MLPLDELLWLPQPQPPMLPCDHDAAFNEAAEPHVGPPNGSELRSGREPPDPLLLPRRSSLPHIAGATGRTVSQQRGAQGAKRVQQAGGEVLLHSPLLQPKALKTQRSRRYALQEWLCLYISCVSHHECLYFQILRLPS